jgi:dolichol-phosphate mannosyltransferase
VKAPLAIIIPVYNEAENITATLESIRERIRTPHTIYIVYDFEEDTTLPVAKALAESMPVRFIKNPVRGVASAIKTGLQNADGEYLLVSMADMSDDYAKVDSMYKLMEDGYDLVCGSRYMQGGGQIGGPLLKKLFSRAAGLTLHYIAGIPTHDATNSFKMYRKSMVDAITIESRQGFEIGIELLVKAYSMNYKITELPCVWTDRTAGKSRFKLFKWLPSYLRWYFYGLKKGILNVFRKG